MAEKMDSEREAFEKWARQIGISVMKKTDGDYVESYTRHVWDAFRAGRKPHLTQPAQAVDVGYDNALNDAGWAFIEAMQYQLPGPIFNNVKPALKAAIEKWLATRALGTAQEDS